MFKQTRLHKDILKSLQDNPAIGKYVLPVNFLSVLFLLKLMRQIQRHVRFLIFQSNMLRKMKQWKFVVILLRGYSHE